MYDKISLQFEILWRCMYIFCFNGNDDKWRNILDWFVWLFFWLESVLLSLKCIITHLKDEMFAVFVVTRSWSLSSNKNISRCKHHFFFKIWLKKMKGNNMFSIDLFHFFFIKEISNYHFFIKLLIKLYTFSNLLILSNKTYHLYLIKCIKFSYVFDRSDLILLLWSSLFIFVLFLSLLYIYLYFCISSDSTNKKRRLCLSRNRPSLSKKVNFFYIKLNNL